MKIELKPMSTMSAMIWNMVATALFLTTVFETFVNDAHGSGVILFLILACLLKIISIMREDGRP